MDNDLIKGVRASCQAAALVMKAVGKVVRVDNSLLDIEAAAASEMARLGVRSAFLGIHGFPGVICVSVNDEVLHGIPSRRMIRQGDVIKVDLGVVKNGWYSDTASTFLMDDGSPEFKAKRGLANVTLMALMSAITMAKAGNRVFDITQAIDVIIRNAGYSAVEGMTGHGIGRRLHLPPQIPNQLEGYDCSYVLKEGDVIAIEPMVGMGSGKVRVKHDGWTIIMADGKPSAHFEHTILVTKDIPEVLTETGINQFK
jgi:methionyl aminopeptidase